MTTESKKAFEEWAAQFAHETMPHYKGVWDAAWKARGDFDAKVCCTCPEINDLEGRYIADEIRKRGGC